MTVCSGSTMLTAGGSAWLGAESAASGNAWGKDWVNDSVIGFQTRSDKTLRYQIGTYAPCNSHGLEARATDARATHRGLSELGDGPGLSWDCKWATRTARGESAGSVWRRSTQSEKALPAAELSPDARSNSA